MTHRRTSLLTISLFCISCVAVHYESPELVPKSETHRRVAVLPFEMFLNGKVPADLGPEQIAEIEEWESVAFQTSLYHELLDRAGTRHRRIFVDLQPVDETNRILWDSGIPIRRTWAMSPERLARILGVDAVVRTRVEKTRYISDLASWGIEVGNHVIDEATEGRFGWLIPWGLSKTHDIFADASLIDGRDGDLLWEVALHREADWHRPANDVIAGITRKLAKRFPYRRG